MLVYWHSSFFRYMHIFTVNNLTQNIFFSVFITYIVTNYIVIQNLYILSELSDDHCGHVRLCRKYTCSYLISVILDSSTHQNINRSLTHSWEKTIDRGYCWQLRSMLKRTEIFFPFFCQNVWNTSEWVLKLICIWMRFQIDLDLPAFFVPICA